MAAKAAALANIVEEVYIVREGGIRLRMRETVAEAQENSEIQTEAGQPTPDTTKKGEQRMAQLSTFRCRKHRGLEAIDLAHHRWLASGFQ